MTVAAVIAAAFVAPGLLQSVAGWAAARRLAAAPRPDAACAMGPDAIRLCPPVTILKPLHGDEPLLEQALASYAAQDYAPLQVVFGVQSEADPAVAVVRRLQARFPDRDLALVIDPSVTGANRKVANLVNMLPSARHDILVIADSDLHVRPDFVSHVVAALQAPGVGLVTTLYAGLPGVRGIPALLGAAQINHVFLPGACLARAMGRQDCLGATMALRRRTLDRIGGLAALAPHLADDNVLGRLVRAEGLRVALAPTVPATTVPEASLSALWRHEMRWARTIRALVPVAFTASVLQFPIAWSLAALLAAGGAPWAVALFAAAWLVRAVAARGVERAVRPLIAPDAAFAAPLWLLPLRDVLSVVVMAASYAGKGVDWRGHALLADDGVTGSAALPDAVPDAHITPDAAQPGRPARLMTAREGTATP